MTKHLFKAGDRVQWRYYGQLVRGTIIETPKGNVAILQREGKRAKTWAHIDSLQLVAEVDA